MTSLNSLRRIVVALDTTKGRALEIAERIMASNYENAVRCFKVNRLIHEEAASPSEPYLLQALGRLGVDVWADLKLHDIPRTVAGSIEPYLGTCVKYVTVMAKGGIPMMESAIAVGRVDVADELTEDEISIIAVTELTSNTEEEIHLGSGQPAKASVLNLVKDAHLAGVRGIVCSGHELKYLKELQKPDAHKWIGDLSFFIPGITPTWKQKDAPDQKRIMSPEEALKAGADALVIGSAIVNANDPVEALAKTFEEIEAITA